MRDLIILAALLPTSSVTLTGPGGVRAVVADSLLMRQQLLNINHCQHRSPRLAAMDRFMLRFCSFFHSITATFKELHRFSTIDVVEISLVTQKT